MIDSVPGRPGQIDEVKLAEDSLGRCILMIFSNDTNGDAPRRMETQGDDMANSRNIDFC